MREVTFVYPIIRTDYINKSLETLYKYTDKAKFNVIIVDQSIESLPSPVKCDLYIRCKNQGFAKASNEGIVHALRWGSPYIAVVNDDTEFMYSGWWEDLLQEFETDPKIVAVCPESPRVPMWGYGLTNGEKTDILPYKEVYSEEDIAYLKSGDYNEAEIRARHPFEIPATFPFTKRGVIDGIAMWLPVFKREAFIELGLFDERFIWGGGEDYDMLARAYSCAWPIYKDVCGGDGDPQHRRMVSTMRSWVWHWWGQSKDVKETLDPRLFEGKDPWMDFDELYPPELNGKNHMDVWGHYDDNGIRKPFKRVKEVRCTPL